MVRLSGEKVTFCTCLSEATLAFGKMCCPSSLKRKPKEGVTQRLKCTLLSKSTSQSTLQSLKTVWCLRSDKFVHLLANLKTESQSRGTVNS